MTKNIVWHEGQVSRELRQSLLGRKGLTIWLTGLSGSGKSTIASIVERILLERKISAYRLDGDNMRFGLNKDLGFSPEDRTENIRRVSEVCKLLADSTAIAIAAFISPYKSDREEARTLHNNSGIPFVEVYVDVPLSVAEARDPKGLYEKARKGQIKEFTGISAPYESPKNPEIRLNNAELDPHDAALKIIEYLTVNNFISA